MNSEELIILEILEEHPDISLKQLSVLLYMRQIGITGTHWRIVIECNEPYDFHYLHVRKLLEHMELNGYVMRSERHYSTRKRILFRLSSHLNKSKDIYNEP